MQFIDFMPIIECLPFNLWNQLNNYKLYGGFFPRGEIPQMAIVNVYLHI